MYKGEIINSQLLSIISETGHTDTICISDAGLPAPKGVERVNLAWKKNEPGWLDVCKIIYENMIVEKIFLAEEMADRNREMYEQFKAFFGGTKIELIPHEELKKNSRNCRAIIRTGEFSSFCNCIFVAGVNF